MAFFYPEHFPEVPERFDDSAWFSSNGNATEEAMLTALETRMEARVRNQLAEGGLMISGNVVIGGPNQHSDVDDDEELEEDDEYESVEGEDVDDIDPDDFTGDAATVQPSELTHS